MHQHQEMKLTGVERKHIQKSEIKAHKARIKCHSMSWVSHRFQSLAEATAEARSAPSLNFDLVTCTISRSDDRSALL